MKLGIYELTINFWKASYLRNLSRRWVSLDGDGPYCVVWCLGIMEEKHGGDKQKKNVWLEH